MTTTTAPISRIDLQLTPAEVENRDLRHRRMRSCFAEYGFDSVSECQAYSDALADHCNGLPVALAFSAALKAAEAARAAAAAKAALDGAAWRSQQALAAAAERRDLAHRRLAIARGTQAFLQTCRAETEAALDFGRSQEPCDLIAFGARLAGLAATEAFLRDRAIPQLAGELTQAQAALDVLTKAPAAASTKASSSRN